MKIAVPVVVLGLSVGCLVSHASTAPFCVIDKWGCAVSAFNLVAMGYTSGDGTSTTSLTGNVVGPSGGTDIQGRVGAAGKINESGSGNTLPIGGAFQASGSTDSFDPWGANANGYLIQTAGNDSFNGGHIAVGSKGNVYAPGDSSSNYYFNNGGSLNPGGAAPLPTNAADWRTLSKDMITESTYLSTLTKSGTTTYSGTSWTGTNVTLGSVGTCAGAIAAGDATTSNCSNSSWVVLYAPSYTGKSATGTTLDVFNLTANQFESLNSNGTVNYGAQLDFAVPAGATIIVNVAGVSLTFNDAMLINGNQSGDSNNDGGMILFNLYQANQVAIDAQYDAALLAPMAALSGTAQMGGTFIVASVGPTGEVHNVEFNGKLPTTNKPPVHTPEPGSLLLMGTGILGLAVLVRRRLHA